MAIIPNFLQLHASGDNILSFEPFELERGNKNTGLVESSWKSMLTIDLQKTDHQQTNK